MIHKLVKPDNDELEKIKNKDRDTTNKYYLANYDFIKTIAKKYYYRHTQRIFDYEDMTNEVYLYFYRLKFENEIAFITSVSNICCYVVYGGERSFHQIRQSGAECLTILDEPINRGGNHGGEPLHLYDIIPSEKDIISELYPEKDYTDDIFNIVKKFLTPRQQEAWQYFYYTDMTAREVGEKMGININGAQSLKTGGKYRLMKNKEELKESILDLGYNYNF